MDWSTHAREALAQGERVEIHPRGHSMKGKVDDGDVVTLEPADPETLAVGDVVLVRVKGRTYLHLIQACDGKRFLIGNNRGGTNGWVGPAAVYGRAVGIRKP